MTNRVRFSLKDKKINEVPLAGEIADLKTFEKLKISVSNDNEIALKSEFFSNLEKFNSIFDEIVCEINQTFVLEKHKDSIINIKT